MFDDKLFAVFVVISILVLLIIFGLLILHFIAVLDIAFDFSFINGEAVLRALNETNGG